MMTAPLTCPCCQETMVKCIKKRCMAVPWHRCVQCGHWTLNLPEKKNLAFHQKFHAQMPLGTDMRVPAKRVADVFGLGKRRASVLDVGCGDGSFLGMLPDNFACTGVDLDKTMMVHWTHPGVTFLQRNFMDKEFKGTWGLVTAFHVLEHLKDLRAGMERLIKLTRPNGSIVVEVPVDRHRSLATFNGHVQEFTTVSVAHMLYSFRDVLQYQAVEAGLLFPAVKFKAKKRGDPSVTLQWLKKRCWRGGKKRFKGRRRGEGNLE